MIERKSFIRGAIVGLTALVATPKPVEPEVWADWRPAKPIEADIYSPSGNFEHLWPTETPFPCEWPDEPCPSNLYYARDNGSSNCSYCRLRYNTKAVELLGLKKDVVISERGSWGWRRFRHGPHPFPDGSGRWTYPWHKGNEAITRRLKNEAN